MPLVPSGIPVDDGNVVGETKVFTTERPQRPGVETRLDNRTTATFFASMDAILGDAVGLRHASGSGGQTPFQRSCNNNKLWSVVAVEALYLVLRTCKVLHRRDGVGGVLGGLGIDGQVACATVV